MNRTAALGFAALLLCLSWGPVFAQAPAPKFTALDLPRLETNGEFQGMRLFLNLLRLDPSVWDDETVLEHFMAANNCGKKNRSCGNSPPNSSIPAWLRSTKSRLPGFSMTFLLPSTLNSRASLSANTIQQSLYSHSRMRSGRRNQPSRRAEERPEIL